MCVQALILNLLLLFILVLQSVSALQMFIEAKISLILRQNKLCYCPPFKLCDLYVVTCHYDL